MVRRTILLVGCLTVALCATVIVLSACVPPPLPPYDTWPVWTIMVYIDGDNNLESAAIDDFLEMAQIGSDNRLNIVVQMDRRPGFNTSYGDWTDTRRFYIHAGDTPTPTSALMSLGEKNMGDPAVLQEFVVWAVNNYPADHYLLSIWDHGDGWRDIRDRIEALEREERTRDPAAAVGVKAVSIDDTDNDRLYMKEVGDALSSAQQTTGRKLDVVGFDACLMGMVEVAYQLRDNANFMIGSEETEPGDGWPYDTILKQMTDKSWDGYNARQPSQLAKVIVNKYIDAYGPASDVTQAAYDLSKISEMTGTLESFVNAHNAQTDKEWNSIQTSRQNAETYHSCPGSCWGVDLWDFADQVYTNTTNVKSSADAVKQAVGKFVIAYRHGTGRPDSHGVAIYFPPNLQAFNNDPQHTGYQDSNVTYPVAFVQDSHWDNWLQSQYYARFP